MDKSVDPLSQLSPNVQKRRKWRVGHSPDATSLIEHLHDVSLLCFFDSDRPD